jgi:hypothetical protein
LPPSLTLAATALSSITSNGTKRAGNEGVGNFSFPSNDNSKHCYTCPHCGRPVDARDLAQVIAHERAVTPILVLLRRRALKPRITALANADAKLPVARAQAEDRRQEFARKTGTEAPVI